MLSLVRYLLYLNLNMKHTTSVSWGMILVKLCIDEVVMVMSLSAIFLIIFLETGLELHPQVVQRHIYLYQSLVLYLTYSYTGIWFIQLPISKLSKFVYTQRPNNKLFWHFFHVPMTNVSFIFRWLIWLVKFWHFVLRVRS